MPDANDVANAAAANALDGVQSVTVGDRSTVAMDPMKQLDVADRLAARAAVAGTNANGGPVSPFRLLRAAKAVPPGAA